MKFTKEIKVGFLAVLGIMMSVFSYNYLKGINLFDKNRKFIVKYEKVDGLSVSNPVTMNGFKIGKVQKINFNSKNTRELLVDIIIDNDVIFPKTSLAELYETGLIGGKAIAIIPDYKNDSTIAIDGDYLKGVIKPGLTELVNQILPQVQLQIEAVMKNAEIVLQNINTLFDDETKKELKSSIEDFSNLTSSLSETSDEISKLIADNSENLTNSLSDFRSASNNIKSITDSLNSDDIKSITINLNSLVNNLNSITTSLKNSEGTAGKLINDKSIYDNLENATNQLNRLIEDIKLNPSRYINFSVFGKKNK
ncbi:MAG: MlaD family protein [Bacteroidota bacterium]|jgi:phospholipid/cholesterol/gamma-HCH transport system substrate-binding protein|nr:MlaD family protein [Bacteroidota bacterium]GIR21111.1 MAG: mammalian cell entry protein [Flavobacteriales bacterium]|tara:strand:+ start:83 stop:1009 length:927 start_codon:yes stop_codon:yes gene_type:complete